MGRKQVLMIKGEGVSFFHPCPLFKAHLVGSEPQLHTAQYYCLET